MTRIGLVLLGVNLAGAPLAVIASKAITERDDLTIELEDTGDDLADVRDNLVEVEGRLETARNDVEDISAELAAVRAEANSDVGVRDDALETCREVAVQLEASINEYIQMSDALHDAIQASINLDTFGFGRALDNATAHNVQAQAIYDDAVVMFSDCFV